MEEAFLGSHRPACPLVSAKFLAAALIATYFLMTTTGTTINFLSLHFFQEV
jgi:hypothetical protein